MKSLLKYYTRGIMFLFPVFFLPLIVDAYGAGKNWFLGATALLGLVLWVADLVISKKNTIKFNKVFWFTALFAVWALVTWFKLPAGVQMRSLVNPAGMGSVLAILVWVFLWLQISSKEEYEKQLPFLTAAGILTAISSLVVFLLPVSKLPLVWPKDNPLLSINQGWSLTGSVLTEIILLAFLSIEWIKRLVIKLKNKESSNDYLKEAGITAALGLVLFLDFYKIFKSGLVILDGYSSWVIAVETLKRSPIFGMGIGNFIQAFYSYRPVSYNLTKLWSTGFSISSMGILQIWTELGLVGLVLVIALIGNFMRSKKTADFWQGAMVLAILFFLPINLLTLFLVGWFAVSKFGEAKEYKMILNVGENNLNVLPWAISAILITGVGLGGWQWIKIISGEYYMRQSMVAASKNNGGATYELQIKAIGKNPKMADYRKVYSNTNLALAETLLSNKDISDEDKQKASTLIQQSVREAKAAITLDNMNADYWNNLASIYKSLAGVVEGAADWSFQAYQQAVALDPVNPMLKLDMGGLLYAANKFEDADRVFEQVVASKNDYPNGWYNWAYTAKQSNKLAEAVARLTQAVALVPVDSGDYDKANEELDTWKKELEELNKKQQAANNAQAEEKKPETLKTPGPLPTVGAEEKVNVSSREMAPPEMTPSTATQESTNAGENPAAAPTEVPVVTITP